MALQKNPIKRPVVLGNGLECMAGHSATGERNERNVRNKAHKRAKNNKGFFFRSSRLDSTSRAKRRCFTSADRCRSPCTGQPRPSRRDSPSLSVRCSAGVCPTLLHDPLSLAGVTLAQPPGASGGWGVNCRRRRAVSRGTTVPLSRTNISHRLRTNNVDKNTDNVLPKPLTSAHTRKHQPAHFLSLNGAPPPLSRTLSPTPLSSAPPMPSLR